MTRESYTIVVNGLFVLTTDNIIFALGEKAKLHRTLHPCNSITLEIQK